MILQIDTNKKELSSKDLLFIYNFRMFQCVAEKSKSLMSQTKVMLKPKKEAKPDSSDEKVTKEMIVISRFLEFHQKNLLTAPVAESFLHLKWIRIKMFFFLNIFLYTMYLVSVSSLIIWTSYVRNQGQGYYCIGDQEKSCNGSIECNRTLENFPMEIPEMKWRVLWLLLYIFSCLSTLIFTVREIIQICSNLAKYFKSKENWLELLAILSSIAYLATLLIVPFHPDLCCCQTPAPLFGAAAVFLAWIEMSLLIGRFPSIGIYTYMSTQVIRQTLRFFSVYLTTLIAFALCFSILLPRSGIFENPVTSFIKVLVMMIGELEFAEYFTWDAVKETGTSYSNIFTQLVFIMLLVLISMIISNLVIGLTVNNTRELFKIAGIYRLGKTLRQIQDTESIIIYGPIKHFLPARLVENTELLPGLHSSHGSSEPISICVKPLNYIDDVSLSVSNQEFRVYKYDVEKEKESKATNMSLPKWVIDNTFDALHQKEKLITELNLDLERFSTRMDYSGLRNFTSEAFRSADTQSKRATKKISR